MDNKTYSDNDNETDIDVFKKMEMEYKKVETPSMKWEGVYKWYISQFSVSYLKGDNIYVGDSLIKADANPFRKMEIIWFLMRHYSNHPLAPEK